MLKTLLRRHTANCVTATHPPRRRGPGCHLPSLVAKAARWADGGRTRPLALRLSLGRAAALPTSLEVSYTIMSADNGCNYAYSVGPLWRTERDKCLFRGGELSICMIEFWLYSGEMNSGATHTVGARGGAATKATIEATLCAGHSHVVAEAQASKALDTPTN